VNGKKKKKAVLQEPLLGAFFSIDVCKICRYRRVTFITPHADEELEFMEL
jgi:hypothetical protein